MQQLRPARLSITLLALWPALVAPVLGSSAPPSEDGACTPDWEPLFGAPGLPGSVGAMIVHDDGSGPALYAGVSATGVMRWDGSTWSEVGGGMDCITVNALAVHDDGSGLALYAAGFIESAGGTPVVGNIARWDGTTWSAVGGGFLSSGAVRGLAVLDDGSGPALYAGGHFTERLRRWDGTTWTAVGGPSDRVWALASYDDGSGPALYVGGEFASAGGVASSGVARFDGTSWSSVAGGTDRVVRTLLVWDDGGGPRLYAGGAFDTAGGVATGRVARWDGTAWSGLPGICGVSTEVWSLGVHDDGGGPKLHAGGDFVFCPGLEGPVKRWDGSTWSGLGPSSGGTVLALASYDDGSGARLCVGGTFTQLGDVPTEFFGTWDGTWSAYGTGLNGETHALCTWDDGRGPALYFGGSFTGVGGTSARRIARWDGASFEALGSGLSSGSGGVTEANALLVWDDGGGAALYAAGRFGSAGGVSVGNIARWDGAGWFPLGAGVTSTVNALATFDDGTGDALYAGGLFGSAGGAPALRIARWNGTSWSHVGGVIDDEVEALVVHDDGSGPALYVGGHFVDAGPVQAHGIARWDGVGWTGLAGGVTGSSAPRVSALTVWDDGTGPALVAGGLFTHAGGVPALGVARWDGTSWSALGSGFNGEAFALGVFDDGSGPALYAAGDINYPGQPGAKLVRWDGTAWTLFAGDDLGGWQQETRDLLAFDAGDGSALYVAGRFEGTGPTDDHHLARWWLCTPDPFPAFCDASDGSLASCPCAPGNPDSGCDLPQGTGGVRLDVLAQTSSPNGVTLQGSGFNAAGNTAAVAIRSTSLDPASPVVFGDGLRCVNSTPLVRLGAAPALGGVSTHVFGHGAMAGAGTFYYQLWFRSNPSTYCDATAAFNLSSGRAMTW